MQRKQDIIRDHLIGRIPQHIKLTHRISDRGIECTGKLTAAGCGNRLNIRSRIDNAQPIPHQAVIVGNLNRNGQRIIFSSHQRVCIYPCHLTGKRRLYHTGTRRTGNFFLLCRKSELIFAGIGLRLCFQPDFNRVCRRRNCIQI